jgi:hypothetical protein
MGLVLMGAMGAGGLLGLLLAAVLGSIGLVATTRAARTRARAWWIFAGALAVVLPLCIVAVNAYPYAPVRPGSDYDVAAKNLFLQAVGYCASPGLAALIAGLTPWLAASKRASRLPAANIPAEQTADNETRGL